MLGCKGQWIPISSPGKEMLRIDRSSNRGQLFLSHFMEREKSLAERGEERLTEIGVKASLLKLESWRDIVSARMKSFVWLLRSNLSAFGSAMCACACVWPVRSTQGNCTWNFRRPKIRQASAVPAWWQQLSWSPSSETLAGEACESLPEGTI